jgi:hypothetical protein
MVICGEGDGPGPFGVMEIDELRAVEYGVRTLDRRYEAVMRMASGFYL